MKGFYCVCYVTFEICQVKTGCLNSFKQSSMLSYRTKTKFTLTSWFNHPLNNQAPDRIRRKPFSAIERLSIFVNSSEPSETDDLTCHRNKLLW